ncbi:synaptic vesicle membrane protein VAT-1 homolog [Entelurus aequoreus]|uniref:synaptic vesicle membrane protein VAT-1 homolog n=1 Tax=Entelurus aequoreus TaxID=161455 RepID=UPI002B1DE113|nr:synaptic vesicle membrane protein VAT-1 homolog [Entelurus aequoreus]
MSHGEVGPPAQQQLKSAGESSSSSPPEEETCRALVLTGYGGYDKVKLQVKAFKKPALQPGEVLVRVQACGLNFAELMGRQGLYEPLPAPPVTLGMEASGVIEAVGGDVKDRKVGDRVIILSRCGAWQEVVVVPASRAFPMPESMSFEEGAAIPINYMTAYMMLFEMANLKPGKSVLVHMAAGGVGIAATQLCQMVSDVTVFGTASASKHDIIAEVGVTHPIDYHTKDYVEEIGKISPKGAANCVTGQKRSLLAMMKTWYNQLSINTMKLMQTNKAVCGFHLSYMDDDHIQDAMTSLLELYRQGKIKPHIDSCYHFEEVADAMRRMHERQNIGKVILLPQPKKQNEKMTSSSEPDGKK